MLVCLASGTETLLSTYKKMFVPFAWVTGRGILKKEKESLNDCHVLTYFTKVGSSDDLCHKGFLFCVCFFVSFSLSFSLLYICMYMYIYISLLLTISVLWSAMCAIFRMYRWLAWKTEEMSVLLDPSMLVYLHKSSWWKTWNIRGWCCGALAVSNALVKNAQGQNKTDQPLDVAGTRSDWGVADCPQPGKGSFDLSNLYWSLPAFEGCFDTWQTVKGTVLRRGHKVSGKTQ